MQTAQAWFTGGPSGSDQQKSSSSLLADWNSYAASRSAEEDGSSALGFDLEAAVRTANDKVSGTFSVVSKSVREIPGSFQTATSSVPSGKALMYFAMFLASGVFFIFIAFTMFLPVMVLMPQKFAICFTLGCGFIIGSFFALKGPKTQLAHMTSKEYGRYYLRIHGTTQLCAFCFLFHHSGSGARILRNFILPRWFHWTQVSFFGSHIVYTEVFWEMIRKAANSSFLCCIAIDDQGLALLQWKNALNSSTDSLSSWKPTDPNPCKWYGVACSPSSQVTGLSLKTMNLHGPLPSNFGALKSIKTLVISGANITGPIPKSFGDYQELSFLDLSNNQISGEIPPELCRLSKLEYLALDSNSLQGVIPLDIGNLSKLSYLTFYDNDLAGEIPSSIGKLSELEVFRAGGNENLKGQLPAAIGNCSNLVMLGLAETGIYGDLPPAIGLLKKIQKIAIYTSFLSGPIPGEIGNCSELTSLYLYQNSLSGSIPPELGRLQKLRNLLLWQNSLVGSIPLELGQCGELIVMDLSVNLLTGSIPRNLGWLSKLQQLQLSTNQLTGGIPPELSNCTDLTDAEVDNNQLSGEIEIDFRKLQSLTLFYAWQNKLTGSIPASLANCRNLQSVDLSYNNLTGEIPAELFGLKNLTKLLLLSNQLSGFVPPEIGNCTNLFRLRLNGNRLAGTIPAEIGSLKNLNFLDMSENLLTGRIPPAISSCVGLQFLDLHSNGLMGALPESLPASLQFLDLSNNRLSGELNARVTHLPQLTKLILGKNQFTGSIPPELSSCSKLQLLDLGDNALSGDVPLELGRLPSLEISLNLSCNRLSGYLPPALSGLNKLATLDISHNSLSGDLSPISVLQNLISLNISFNSFSGELPDTPFFRKIPLSDLTGNRGLYISGGTAQTRSRRPSPSPALKLTMSVLISIGAVLLLSAAYALMRAHRGGSDVAGDGNWEVTLYQKIEISIDEIIRGLTSANVIGTGSSGVVYRVGPVAVKKMWSAEDDGGAFRNEISTLGTMIRHRNIVKLLGWGKNRKMLLLFYNYLPNGSLSSMIHRGGKAAAGWEERYGIAVGVAEAIAYLHHDCVPAILHGDIKAMNVLLGSAFEPYLADFGLAKVMSGESTGECEGKSAAAGLPPRIAGSYGYMAPELANSMRGITEKSDVYSYGVVLLELLTGKHPLEPSLPGGAHLVQWVREHHRRRQDPAALLDTRLHGAPAYQLQQMLQVLGISVLCISARPDDRPSMKDVVVLLKEIRRPCETKESFGTAGSGGAGDPARATEMQGSSNCSFVMSDCSS
ncbi:putative LRR receptor-like serine/threonine-protein kinase [Apostasia shenzhenica]|uniref:non-specific serine/threonine protein kinase n=1 Tax=Apostasia shenzhenica TaxID=1088818 RepID=A0A2I0A6P0_9ASPA|nr:putative LRR receptor-like serine/threonine-protein kinase [Apostasia shenzhenica]